MAVLELTRIFIAEEDLSLLGVELRSGWTEERILQRITDICKSAGVLFPSKFPMIEKTKMLFWNCRGAGNKAFRRCFKNLKRTHKFDIAILFETKVRFVDTGNFFFKQGLTSNHHVDPEGRSGGIWVIWDEKEITVTPLVDSTQSVHVKIMRKNYEEWLLSAVYASPVEARRTKLWDELKGIAEVNQEPWLIAGDFNDFTGNEERRSFTQLRNYAKTMKFVNNIDECNLLDLGNVGPRLTWTNNREGLANTQERLDRALCNKEWKVKFPNSLVTCLPRTYSDHSPLLVDTQGEIKLNTDGSKDGDYGIAGYGGLFRDDAGNWIKGFMGQIGHSSVLEAELWGIHRGLVIIHSDNKRKICIETDSMEAMNAITDNLSHDSPYLNIVMEIRGLLRGCSCDISYIPREANEAADGLAKLGRKQKELLVHLENPPMEVMSILVKNIMAVDLSKT